MTSRDPESQGRDPDIFEASYHENNSRSQVSINGTPIGNQLGESNGDVTDDVT